jgi:hypothetical protein
MVLEERKEGDFIIPQRIRRKMNCKICNKDKRVTCICGVCYDCIKELGHDKCHKIAREQKDNNLDDCTHVAPKGEFKAGQTKEKDITNKNYVSGFKQGRLSQIEEEIKFLENLVEKSDYPISDTYDKIKQLNKEIEELKE